MNVRNLQFRTLIPLLILFCGCFRNNLPKNFLEIPNARTAIVFIPGYKGTTLVDDNGKALWITPWEATFGSTSLALPTENLGLPEHRDLLPKEVLKQIVVVPWVYEFDTYKRFLNKLREKLPENVALEEFPYDWRLSSATNSRLLDSKISELRSKGAERIILVGHSMGGIVTSYFLRYGPQRVENAISDWSGVEKVDGAVIISTPFKGALNIFCDLQSGDQTAFNSALLSKESEGTMESTYELLPTDKMDSEFWLKNRLGILREDLSGEQRFAREEFVKGRLSHAARLRELLLAPANDQQERKFPMYQFIGTGYPVSDSAEIDAATGECKDRLSKEGDGTVTIESALLPDSFIKTLSPTTKVLKSMHAEILLEESVLESIVSLSSAN